MGENVPAVREPPLTRGRVDRLTLGVVVIVVALVGVSIGVAATVGRGQQAADLSSPAGVTLAYESAIQRGEADAAWNLLSSAARAGTTRQEFLTRAASIQHRDTRVSVANVRIDGDTAHLDLVRVMPSQGFLDFGRGAVTSSSPVTLVREPDGWRISVPPDAFVIRPPVGPRP